MRRLLRSVSTLSSTSWAVAALQRCRPTRSSATCLERTVSRPWFYSTAVTPIVTHQEEGFEQVALLDKEDGTVHPANSINATGAVEPVLAIPRDAIPLMCPGCGAPSQTIEENEPGYYGRTKTQQPKSITSKRSNEDAVFKAALGRGDIDGAGLPTAPEPDEIPICDRCHQLLHHSVGTSIEHPSVQSVREMIEESPHRYNHIYHVVDAADFPMSVIPNLMSALRLPRMRTQNRRSKHVTYVKGRVAEVSFVITRADLLAPKKEQVDSMLPYMRDVLRDTLGRQGRNVRLGNVRMVSAKRGWWTPLLKEEIYRRGGAGWMVGKVNVGKSSLMEVVFPKGRSGVDVDISKARQTACRDGTRLEQLKAEQPALTELIAKEQPDALSGLHEPQPDKRLTTAEDTPADRDDFRFDESELSLLPPARKEEMYPVMPVISALPGTTASPIRLPFGNGRGELIDLPGIERSALAEYVIPSQHKQLIMHHRVVPDQKVIRRQQSLLLGGLIRITPLTDDLDVLMYAFVPEAMHAHATSTDKAIAIQTGMDTDGMPYGGTVETNATPAAKATMRSAGVFKLQWDVTKRRTGPLTDKAAGKMKPQNLPFVVYGMDLVIEGVGWVEITAQVRRPRGDAFGELGFELPAVEVFSPMGSFVTARQPMNAWTLGGPLKGSGRSRPRQTISYKRRMEGGKKGSPPAAVT